MAIALIILGITLWVLAGLRGDHLEASSACPICGQDFPHSASDPIHAAAAHGVTL